MNTQNQIGGYDMKGFMLEVFIGDYTVNIWIPEGREPKEIIKEQLNYDLAQYGLKVVNV